MDPPSSINGRAAMPKIDGSETTTFWGPTTEFTPDSKQNGLTPNRRKSVHSKSERGESNPHALTGTGS